MLGTQPPVQAFYVAWDIKKKTIRHPQSNGTAEIHVRVIKEGSEENDSRKTARMG